MVRVDIVHRQEEAADTMVVEITTVVAAITADGARKEDVSNSPNQSRAIRREFGLAVKICQPFFVR